MSGERWYIIKFNFHILHFLKINTHNYTHMYMQTGTLKFINPYYTCLPTHPVIRMGTPFHVRTHINARTLTLTCLLWKFHFNFHLTEELHHGDDNSPWRCLFVGKFFAKFLTEFHEFHLEFHAQRKSCSEANFQIIFVIKIFATTKSSSLKFSYRKSCKNVVLDYNCFPLEFHQTGNIWNSIEGFPKWNFCRYKVPKPDTFSIECKLSF